MSERIEAAADDWITAANVPTHLEWPASVVADDWGERGFKAGAEWMRQSYAPLVAAAREAADMLEAMHKGHPYHGKAFPATHPVVALRSALESLDVDGEFEGAGDRG